MSSKPTTKCWAALWRLKASWAVISGNVKTLLNHPHLTLIDFVNIENQNYLVTVEKFFLTLKDSGLALSATDYDLIQQWEGRGIPVNVVCRGIENGVEEFSRQNTRQSSRMGLSYLKVFVEEEMERSQS
jgi:hypothetical protein